MREKLGESARAPWSRRQIFTDGRPLPEDPNPSWYGYSSGHWDGDVLVVATNGLRDGLWLDFQGDPITSSARLTERFRRPNFGALDIDVTIDDPKAYTRPFTVTVHQALMVDTELLEFVCLENEKDQSHRLPITNRAFRLSSRGADLSGVLRGLEMTTEPNKGPASARVFNPQYRERLFALIDGAPFVRHMGMRITDLAWGRATFELTAAEFRLQPFGVVHGGNIATLIDTATFWACFLAMDSDEDGLVSVDLKLNYLAPARVEALRCTGTLIKAGKTISYAEAEVLTADNRMIAHGTSTLMRLPGLGVKLGIPLWAE